MSGDLDVKLVGDGLSVSCVDGIERPYLSLDSAASTSALPAVASRVQSFLPWYSSVHRGAGWKSQVSTDEYEGARTAFAAFAGRTGTDDVAIICRNTTEAINHLAYRLRLNHDDVVVTSVVEHHANLLPWSRVARCRYVECDATGTFAVDAIEAALDQPNRPRLLALTGASNVTGWVPPIDEIIAAAHERGVPVLVDAAQLAPHRPLPRTADYLAWSGHKMYAPFGAGVLVGPRATFASGDPFLAGGGAVDLVDLDDVLWSDPPDREEAGSPNVVGAVALHAAIDGLNGLGWEAIRAHDDDIAIRLHDGLTKIEGVRLLGASAQPGGLPSRRLSSTVCPTRSSPLGSAPSTLSVSVTAAFALTPTSLVFWECRPGSSRTTAPQSCTATTGEHLGQCEPAPGSPRAHTTSTVSWTLSPASSAAIRLRWPTTRTSTAETIGQEPTTPLGRTEATYQSCLLDRWGEL